LVEGLSSHFIEVDEYHLKALLTVVCDDVGDGWVIEVFDVLDYKSQGVITFREFYVFILLLAALESFELTKFLYHYGGSVYEQLSQFQDTINRERMRKIGRIIGFSELSLLKTSKELDYLDQDPLSFEEFQLFYFSIFDEHDKSNVVPDKKLGKGNKSKGRCGGKLRVCTLL